MDKKQELENWKARLKELIPYVREQIEWMSFGEVRASVNPECPEKLLAVAKRLVELQNSVGEYQRSQISKEDIEKIKYFSKTLKIGFDDVVKLAVSNSRYVSKDALEARGVAAYILEIQSVYKKYYEDYGVFPINAMSASVKRACRNFETDVKLSEKIEAIIEVFLPEKKGIQIVDKDISGISPKRQPLTTEEFVQLIEYFNNMECDGKIDRCFEEENQRKFLKMSKLLSRANVSLSEFLEEYTGLTYSKCYEMRVVPAVTHMIYAHQVKNGTTKNITHTDPYLRHKIEVAQRVTKKYSMVDLIEELKIKGDNLAEGRSQLSESEIAARRKRLVYKLMELYPDHCIDEQFISQHPADYEELKLISNRCGFNSMDEFLESNGFHRMRSHSSPVQSVIYLSEGDMDFYNFKGISPSLLSELGLRELPPAEFIGVYNKLISKGLDHSQFEHKNNQKE